ncbi:STAS domain-containing protein [Rubellicoccus peritrichatus]|uniref:STAS domain-containing protein n=1 Tax=Rubellicoccus peritrichatus TaxID=3080537 RepID=A0AAQ3QU40_9BACT|nr:STAS domain-containing protein [Puniceicoccus sp. CR14]WOO42016.1 STAS domain-containing protein [Puniceicoccus sp. CR14]
MIVENFDAALAPEFKEYVSVLKLSEIDQITVDMKSVEFMDSSGIGALLFLNNQLPPDKRPLKLLNTAPHVVSLLELLRVHRMLKVEPSA